MNMSPKDISSATGLSIDEINDIDLNWTAWLLWQSYGADLFMRLIGRRNNTDIIGYL
jgi:hypothetical protein